MSRKDSRLIYDDTIIKEATTQLSSWLCLDLEICPEEIYECKRKALNLVLVLLFGKSSEGRLLYLHMAKELIFLQRKSSQ